MKIAIVTGASSGIGREFARQIQRLYRQLDEIWLVARRKERLQELKNELTVPVRIFDGDLRRDSIYERLSRELILHRPDVRMLVNSAGCGRIGNFSETDLNGQMHMLDINCRALTRMTALCLPYMGRGSRLIQLASAAAFCPQPGFAVYAATKSYVYSLSRALSVECRKKGIVVTAVCPGPVDTEVFDQTGRKIGNGKKAFRVQAPFVVRQALLDAAYGKQVSVYGLPMNLARIAAHLLPDRFLAMVMARVSVDSEKEEKEGI